MTLPKLTFDDLFEITEAEVSQYTVAEIQAAIDLAVAMKGEEYPVWKVISNLRGIRMGKLAVGSEEGNNDNI